MGVNAYFGMLVEMMPVSKSELLLSN